MVVAADVVVNAVVGDMAHWRRGRAVVVAADVVQHVWVWCGVGWAVLGNFGPDVGRGLGARSA